MKSIMHVSLACIAVSLVSGCALAPINVPVKVYNVDTGDVLQGSFLWTGRTGKASAVDSKGVKCEGEYFTVSRDQQVFGISQGYTYGGGRVGTTASTSSYTVSADSENGTAILRCQDGTVVDCTYTNDGGMHGTGACKDNRGNRYRLMY